MVGLPVEVVLDLPQLFKNRIRLHFHKDSLPSAPAACKPWADSSLAPPPRAPTVAGFVHSPNWTSFFAETFFSPRILGSVRDFRLCGERRVRGEMSLNWFFHSRFPPNCWERPGFPSLRPRASARGFGFSDADEGVGVLALRFWDSD
jgi:hypothetical protein